MARRPDYADRGGEAARMSQHRPNESDSTEDDCEPASHSRHCPVRPLIWKDIPLIVAAIQEATDKKLNRILKEIKTMGEATAAALAELTKDLHRLADGFVALQAENAALKDALAQADAVKAQAVADAIAADDAIDSAAIAEADAIVEGLSPEPVVEPPVEEPPAEG